MSERLFLFVQFEFPWELGPPDGRYLLRAREGGEAERVIVLETLGALQRRDAWGQAMGRRRSRSRPASAEGVAEPVRVPTARVTIIDPVPVAAERQATSWLGDLDAEAEAGAAAAVLNRVLYFHRIACGDPYVQQLSPAQALVIRAGWGEGEELAGGRWRHARELSWAPSGRGSSGRWPGGRGHSTALRPAERLAQLLGARATPLVCEEIALRARMDLDQGRLEHAAIELKAAYEAGLAELRSEDREDMLTRIAELEALQTGVAEEARAAQPAVEEHPVQETVRHALERLEAALRARTAAGLG